MTRVRRNRRLPAVPWELIIPFLFCMAIIAANRLELST